MNNFEKIKAMDSSELSRLLCDDFEHTSCCNVCWYYYKDECCDLCEVGIKLFFDSEVEDEQES